MDVVVTVPKFFQYGGKMGLAAWIAEGDPAGAPWSGQLWAFSINGKPTIAPGERVYVVCEGKLRGYAPLVAVERGMDGKWNLIRGGDAVAVTLPGPLRGFQGYRYRWWQYSLEIPSPAWATP